MKCELYENLLEEYLDGELAPDDHGRVSDHLITCANCAEAFAALRAEQELFARYDREIEVSPVLWSGIEEQISVSEASYGWWMKIAAVVILSIGLGSVYLFSKKEEVTETPPQKPAEQQGIARFTIPAPKKETRIPKRIRKPSTPVRDNPGVLSTDLAYLDIDDQDTVKHIEQTQNLLRSIRNVPVSDGDEEIDVTYDKALSQRLLNENVVLRRDAEMKAKFPTKTLLADLEPLLIDIANLPDHARPQEVREIKERVQKTEIVAALMEYRDRGTNNR
ncbi:MAG TPA: zf-HC2 domain-containing protein [Pyrinomonadaceae bacterium]|nr:zf-HC2 domain-containing protein [Pyrinomonadaceae bacterium]